MGTRDDGPAALERAKLFRKQLLIGAVICFALLLLYISNNFTATTSISNTSTYTTDPTSLTEIINTNGQISARDAAELARREEEAHKKAREEAAAFRANFVSQSTGPAKAQVAKSTTHITHKSKYGHTIEIQPHQVPALRMDQAPKDKHGQLIPLVEGDLREMNVETLGDGVHEAQVVWMQADPGREMGIVLLFHGCTHDAQDWFQFPEEKVISSQLLYHGYSLVAFNSHDRTNRKCWDSSWPLTSNKGNIDVNNVLAAFNVWRVREHKTSLPIIAVGASSGGVFASIIARVIPLHAAILIVSPGSDDSYNTVHPALVQPLSEHLLVNTIQQRSEKFESKVLLDPLKMSPLPPITFVYMPRDTNWASTLNLQRITEILARDHGQQNVRSLACEQPKWTEDFFSKRIQELHRLETQEQPHFPLSKLLYMAAVESNVLDKEQRLFIDPRNKEEDLYSRLLQTIRTSTKISAIIPSLSPTDKDTLKKKEKELIFKHFDSIKPYIEEELNVLYSLHEMTSDHIESIIQWLENMIVYPPKLVPQMS